MHTTRRLLVVALAAFASACSPPPIARNDAAPRAASTDPVATVRAIYEPYLSGQSVPKLVNAAPWTEEMRGLLQHVDEVSRGQVVLKSDPIIGAENWRLSDLHVALESPPADRRAVAIVRFKNKGADQTLDYDLVEVEGAWRVDNIRSKDWILRELIAQGLAEARRP